MNVEKEMNELKEILKKIERKNREFFRDQAHYSFKKQKQTNKHKNKT